MDGSTTARFALRTSSVVVAGVVNQPSPPNSRRSFLKALAVAPLAAVPLPAIPVKPVFVIPDEYEIDFRLFKPCDIHFHDEKDADGFTLELYDLTNRRGYEGYIRWWAVPEQDFENGRRDRAYASGIAQAKISEESRLMIGSAADGIVSVRFK